MSGYVPESEQVLAPKPEDNDVVVFVGGDEPESTYRVIGRVQFDTRAYPGISSIVKSVDVSLHVLEVLKEEARKRGADALVDFTLTWDGLAAVGRSKAVVFE